MESTPGTSESSIPRDDLVYQSLRHFSPGRFFAANELKAMLAFIVLNYDLKLGGDGKRPPNLYFAQSVIPALDGQVMFRKRQAPETA